MFVFFRVSLPVMFYTRNTKVEKEEGTLPTSGERSTFDKSLSQFAEDLLYR